MDYLAIRTLYPNLLNTIFDENKLTSLYMVLCKNIL